MLWSWFPSHAGRANNTAEVATTFLGVGAAHKCKNWPSPSAHPGVTVFPGVCQGSIGVLRLESTALHVGVWQHHRNR